MIRVFFNQEGYYVTGEGIEVSQRCSPALTDCGDRIFQPLHHAYGVCYQALKEIRDIRVQDDVIVYSDSRIIDEITNVLPPLDDTCERWLKVIGRHMLPSIRAVVFFRKKSTNEISVDIARGHEAMFGRLNEKQLDAVVAANTVIKRAGKRKKNLVQRLRSQWFGETNG